MGTDCREPLRFDVHLPALFRPALPITPARERLHSKIRSRTRNIEFQKTRIAEFDHAARPDRSDLQGLRNLGGDRPGQRRGHGVSDLPGAVPLGCVQAEPVREAVEPRHLPHCDAAVVTVVDRPGTRECPSRTVGAGAQRVRQAVFVKFEESADRFYRAGLRFGEPALRDFRMPGPGAGRENGSVPIPDVAEMPGAVGKATHLARVRRRLVERTRFGFVVLKKFGIPIGVRQVSERIAAGGTTRQSDDIPLVSCDSGRRFRVAGDWYATARAKNEQAFARLRRAVVRGIEHLPGQAYRVSHVLEFGHQFFEKRSVLADRKALDVFEYKGPGLQFRHQAHEVTHQPVARVVQRAMADQGETLAGRAAEHAVDGPFADSGRVPYLGCRQVVDRTRNHGGIGKIEMVNGAMNRIDIHGRNDVEPGLFEPEAQSART